MGVKISQGEYILFLEGNDCILSNTLSILYLINEHQKADIIHSIGFFEKNINGNISIANKRFIKRVDTSFQNLTMVTRLNIDDDIKLKMLSTQQMNSFFATKLFKRKFLIENNIIFKEEINNNFEILFLIECMYKTSNVIFIPQIFYIAPNEGE